MQSISPLSSDASRSCVQSDFPDCASVCRLVSLSASPACVEVLWVVVRRVGVVCERRVVKRETCARARAEARVPMRRVGGVEGVWVWEVGKVGAVVGGGVAIGWWGVVTEGFVVEAKVGIGSWNAIEKLMINSSGLRDEHRRRCVRSDRSPHNFQCRVLHVASHANI